MEDMWVINIPSPNGRQESTNFIRVCLAVWMFAEWISPKAADVLSCPTVHITTCCTYVTVYSINVSCLCHRSMYERDGAVREQHQPHPEEPRGGAGSCWVREGCWLRPVPGAPCSPLRLLPLAAPRPVAGPGASHTTPALAGDEELGITRWHDAQAHRSVFTSLPQY